MSKVQYQKLPNVVNLRQPHRIYARNCHLRAIESQPCLPLTYPLAHLTVPPQLKSGSPLERTNERVECDGEGSRFMFGSGSPKKAIKAMIFLGKQHVVSPVSVGLAKCLE